MNQEVKVFDPENRIFFAVGFFQDLIYQGTENGMLSQSKRSQEFLLIKQMTTALELTYARK